MWIQQPVIPPESQLIKSAVEGDLEAFNELVLKNQDSVYRLAYAMLRDRDAAQDATQDTFISAFQNIRGFRGGSFQGWLLRIAKNTCYDVIRSVRRHLNVALFPEDANGTEMDSASWLADARPTPEAELEGDELARSLYERLDALPRLYRSVITLVDLNGLDYAVAAQALGVPVGTIKSRLARARLRMRETLSRQFEDSPTFHAVGCPVPA